MKKSLAFACLQMAAAICLGAMGAHALKGKISPDSLSAYKTGVEYHIYHALSLIILSLNEPLKSIKKQKRVNYAIHLGIFLFSGSIYLLSTRNLLPFPGISNLGPLTPLGGLIWIGSWLYLALQLFFDSRREDFR